jgi:hypothetical protein
VKLEFTLFTCCNKFKLECQRKPPSARESVLPFVPPDFILNNGGSLFGLHGCPNCTELGLVGFGSRQLKMLYGKSFHHFGGIIGAWDLSLYITASSTMSLPSGLFD